MKRILLWGGLLALIVGAVATPPARSSSGSVHQEQQMAAHLHRARLQKKAYRHRVRLKAHLRRARLRKRAHLHRARLQKQQHRHRARLR